MKKSIIILCAIAFFSCSQKKHVCSSPLSMKDTIFIDFDNGYGNGWQTVNGTSYTRNALITDTVSGALYITADTTKPIIAIKNFFISKDSISTE